METRDPTGHDNLVLVYNMACPLKCDFCCHAVEDYGPIKFKPDFAAELIRQAGEMPSVNIVVFTGGEPFLYYDQVRELIAGKAPHLGARIVTAAHWATSKQAALDRLGPLVEAGLTELSISTDSSHQKYVPAQQAEWGMQAALELGLAGEFAGVFWNKDERIEDTIDVPAGALTVRGLVAPIGRARRQEQNFGPDHYDMGPQRFYGCGISDRVDITVYPDGEVYPCCSGGFNIEAKLSFGNAKTEPLSGIVSKMKRDAYTKLVIEAGLGPLYEIAELRFPHLLEHLPDPEQFTSICELCSAVHGNDGLLERIQPLIAYASEVFEAANEMEVSGQQADYPTVRPTP